MDRKLYDLVQGGLAGIVVSCAVGMPHVGIAFEAACVGVAIHFYCVFKKRRHQ